MFERTALADGPRVITRPLPGRALGVDRRVRARRLAPREAPSQAGVAHFLEHLTFKGTRAYPSTRALSEAIEGVGGSFNAATDREATVYWVRVPRREAERAMDVLGELIVPAAPRRWRRSTASASVIIEEIRWLPRRPGRVRPDPVPAGDVRRGAARPGDLRRGGRHPRPARRTAIRDFWRRRTGPANTVVAVAGDLGHAEAVELAAPRSGAATARSRGSSRRPSLPPASAS